MRRARFLYPPPSSVPSQPLSCHGSEAGVPRCGGSQVLQSGEQRELRGQAAAQAVVVEVPARGASERDHGGTATDAECGKCDARASPTRRHTLRPLGTLLWLGGGGVPSCGGSHSRQLGKQPELRGHAAGQALVVKVPARGAPEHEEGWRGVPVGASDPRRASDARCASPERVATTLYATLPLREGCPPSPPGAALPTPARRWQPPSLVHGNGGRCNGAHSSVPL